MLDNFDVATVSSFDFGFTENFTILEHRFLGLGVLGDFFQIFLGDLFFGGWKGNFLDLDWFYN